MAHSLSPHRLYGLTFILSLFLQLVAAQHWDGPSPYGQKFAPDVTSVVTGWDVSYPSFEGNNSYPQPIINGSDGLGTSTLTARAAKDFYLRILPLGASITEGSASSDGNGYRKWLRQQLRWKGWKVNMVGSKTNGNMADRVCTPLFSTLGRCQSFQDVGSRLTNVITCRTMKDILVGSSHRCTMLSCKLLI